MIGDQVRIEKHARCRKPADAQWVAAVVTAARTALGAVVHFHGDFELGGVTRARHIRDDVNRWTADLAEQWSRVEGFSAAFYGDDGDVSVRCGFESAALDLSAAGRTEANALALAAALDPALRTALAGTDGSLPAMHGGRRRFYTQRTPTREWFLQAGAAVNAQVAQAGYFDGRFKLRSGPYADVIRRDFAAWQQSVADRWDDVTNFHGWLSGARSTIGFTCDTQRELVDLEVHAPTAAETDAIFAALIAALDVRPVTDEPYRYRKFTRSFTVKDWKSPEVFARAVRDALTTAFARDPVVADAFVEEGAGSTDLISCADLDAFAQTLKQSDDKVQRAKFYVEGPQGVALGIFLDRPRQRLELRSSLDRKTFNAVSDVFENAMDLKLLKEEKPADAPAEKRESIRGKVALALAVPIAAALVSIFSADVYKQVRGTYVVEIVGPAKQRDGAPTPTAGGEVQVHWVVKTAQWWDTRDEDGVRAHVRVFDGSGRVEVDRSGAQPGTTFTLLPGRHDIEVVAGGQNKRDRVSIVVPTPVR